MAIRIREFADGAKSATLTGGKIAANARKELEEQLGRSVLSPLNATTPYRLDDKKTSE